MKKIVTIIDYGMGNILSVKNVIEYLGYKCQVTNDHKIIKNGKFLILPGVGSFKNAMQEIKKLKIDNAINESIKKNGKILGICLGMQLLAISSVEDGNTRGIGLAPGKILKLNSLTKKKIPHIGFNLVKTNYYDGLFSGLEKNNYFYFVHSYFFLPNDAQNFKLSYCNYGKKFVSSYESPNICGTQFHPEKSQSNGLKLIKNFLKKNA